MTNKDSGKGERVTVLKNGILVETSRMRSN